MKKRKEKEVFNNLAAKKVTSVLTSVLRADANSASCTFAYQPKAPEGLERYKKKP